MSMRKQGFLRATDLLASHATVPSQVNLYQKAESLFAPLYVCFGGHVANLDQVVCDAKHFSQGDHRALCHLSSKDQEEFIDFCENARVKLIDIAAKKPKDRDCKQCQDLVTELHFVQARFLEGGSHPYP